LATVNRDISYLRNETFLFYANFNMHRSERI
jgi:hypothetical protein